MRTRPRRLGPQVALLAGILAALVPLVGPGPAAAATPAGPAPAGGWVVGRVRFEPLDPAATGLTADGGPGHRGALELGPGGTTVVDLAVDDYVNGIQEVPATWPAAALQAQAVAARTFALYTARQARSRPGRSPLDPDICATDSCQVYTGLASEQRPGGAGWVAAATATAGKVLLYKGAPLLAKYSSSNGGRSVSGGQPYLPSVADPDDAASPLNHWSSPLSLDGLTAVLGLPGRATGASRDGGTVVVAWERPAAASPSAPAPAPAPAVTPPPAPAPPPASAPPPTPGPEKGESRFPVADFRARVNGGLPRGSLPRALPSDQFTLASGPGGVVADGHGFGHAIGMSQYGAYGKALRGLSADAILASYYGGARSQPAPAGTPTDLRVAVADVADPTVQAVAAGPPTGGAPPGSFRVVGDGAPLATVATGAWKVAPGPRAGTVRVVPPPEQAGALTLDQAAAGRTTPDPAAPVAVAFRLSQPALVAVAGAPAVPLPAGDQRVEVPGGPEARTVTIAADAGGGRTATAAAEVASVAPPVAAQPVAPAPAGPEATSLSDDPSAFGSVATSPARASAAGGGRRWVAAPALVLLAGVGWTVRRVRRRRARPSEGVRAA